MITIVIVCFLAVFCLICLVGAAVLAVSLKEGVRNYHLRQENLRGVVRKREGARLVSMSRKA